jgi:UDP-2,3-diacylglucosamine pyrophosphatase LpxH
MKKRNVKQFNSSQSHYRTIWLSDIHLGSRDCHANYLLQFLHSVSCERLYLVGDIVDMLALKKRMYWPDTHAKVLKAIHQIAVEGTEVIYIPGNHDMPLRHFDQGLLINVEIHRQYIHETADGKKLLVVHGDEFDHAVLYKAMNRLIGDSAYDLMVFINRWMHRIRCLLGLPFWSVASYLKNNISQAKATIEAFEQAAVSEAKQRDLDGVVCGHIHKANIRDIDGISYFNDGDWTETCSALVESTNGDLELLYWEDIATVVQRPQPMIVDAA